MLAVNDTVEVSLEGDPRRFRATVRHADEKQLIVSSGAVELAALEVGTPLRLVRAHGNDYFCVHSRVLMRQKNLIAVANAAPQRITRRKFPRTPCNLEGAFTFDLTCARKRLETWNEPQGVRVVDIGTGGARFLTDRLLAADTLFAFSVTLGEDVDGHIVSEAVALRCGLAEDPNSELTHVCAVRFHALSRVYAIRLQRYISELRLA